MFHRALVPGYFTQFTTVYGERLTVHTPVALYLSCSHTDRPCLCVCVQIALLKILLAAAPTSKAKTDSINILADVLPEEMP